MIPLLSKTNRQVLQALLQSPSCSASAGELRTELGLSSVVQVNGSVGRIGRKLYNHFGNHPLELSLGDFEWWTVLATGLATPDRGFVWQLHDEVVTGLIACGYISTANLVLVENAKPAPKY